MVTMTRNVGHHAADEKIYLSQNATVGTTAIEKKRAKCDKYGCVNMFKFELRKLRGNNINNFNKRRKCLKKVFRYFNLIQYLSTFYKRENNIS